MIFSDILAEMDVVLTEKSGVVQSVAVLEAMFPVANDTRVLISHFVILLDNVDTHLVHVIDLQILGTFIFLWDLHICSQVGKCLFIEVQWTVFRVNVTFSIVRFISCIARPT